VVYLISEKLLEFNRVTGDGVHKVQESYLEGVVKLAHPDATANPLYMQVLKQLLEWPQGVYEVYLCLEYWPVRRKLLCSLKNGVFWVVTPCGSCKNRRFGGTWRLLHQGDKNR
jgi:hypothetical protein